MIIKKRRNKPRLLQHRERKIFPQFSEKHQQKNATQVKRNKFNILWTFIIKEFVKNPELHKIFIGIILLKKKLSCKHGLRWVSRTSSWSRKMKLHSPTLRHAEVMNFVNHAANAPRLAAKHRIVCHHRRRSIKNSQVQRIKWRKNPNLSHTHKTFKSLSKHLPSMIHH